MNRAALPHLAPFRVRLRLGLLAACMLLAAGAPVSETAAVPRAAPVAGGAGPGRKVLPPPGVAVGPAAECPPAPLAPIPLPHTAATLAANKPLVVVAVGSSSTEGWLASDVAHSYPAVLQGALNLAFPRADFSVINRGIGGQDASEELARLDTDVIAVHPQLVIWQVGANGALRDTDPAVFRRLVTAGLAKLRAAGADVVLMDNQRTPRMVAAPENNRIDQALAGVAAENGVPLFARSALMDAWGHDGHAMAEFTASDGLHMNDSGYRCVAQALAESITLGLDEKSP
ncbi:MAG: SGNH/GDSL hydrolase family protein [Janthinobacterium lividum]